MTAESFECCGVRIAALTPAGAVSELHALASAGGGHAVHLCNAYTLSLASKHSDYRAGFESAALNLADGTPVVWAGKAAGNRSLTQAVRGPTLMLDVMRTGVSRGAKHYLYGGNAETTGMLKTRLQELIPDICIVGSESPPFRPLSSAEVRAMTERITRASPDFLWVGLGTPKQDVFLARHAKELDCVCLGVGAAFDFTAGTVREAPAWSHSTGLEWLFRLSQDPRRLWRRYLFGNAVFVRTALAEATRCRIARPRPSSTR